MSPFAPVIAPQHGDLLSVGTGDGARFPEMNVIAATHHLGNPPRQAAVVGPFEEQTPRGML